MHHFNCAFQERCLSGVSATGIKNPNSDISNVISNDTICYLMHNTSRERVAPALKYQYLNNFIKDAGLPASVSLLCSPQHCLHPKDSSPVHDKDTAISMPSSDRTTCKGKYSSSTVCFLRTKKPWQGSPADSPYSIGHVSISHGHCRYSTLGPRPHPDHLQFTGHIPYSQVSSSGTCITEPDGHLWSVLSLCMDQAGKARVKALSSDLERVRGGN